MTRRSAGEPLPALALLVITAACGSRGQVLVSIDTDLPVPELVDRLRIDALDADGCAFIDSHDVLIGVESSDTSLIGATLPVSFGIDAASGGAVLLRVRAYREGDVRTYTGSRETRGELSVPGTEPQPGLAVDRLVRVELDPDESVSVDVVLRGECFGTEASLATLETCVDTEGVRERVSPALALPGRDPPVRVPTLAGTWRGAAPSDCGEEPDADRICMPNKAFVLGDETVIGFGADAATPRRLVVVSPFFIDRYEYTIGRYRDALERGFDPGAGGPPIDAEDLVECGQLRDPASQGPPIYPNQPRMPLPCVDFETARALCEEAGGTLPTEAQWERAAASDERVEGRRYPWGDEAPANPDMATFLRRTMGPAPVDASPWADNDQTAEGVVGMGANLAEWTRDAHLAYAGDCWRDQPLRDPRAQPQPKCPEDPELPRTVKGGSWRGFADDTRVAGRTGAPPDLQDDAIGFRCVYPLLGSRPD